MPIREPIVEMRIAWFVLTALVAMIPAVEYAASVKPVQNPKIIAKIRAKITIRSIIIFFLHTDLITDQRLNQVE